MLFGRKVDFNRVRGAGAMRETDITALSGGQMQRLAVYVHQPLLYNASGITLLISLSPLIVSSRTFIRSLISEKEHSVGLLLFDEPSASLDPRAEHGKLRQLPTFVPPSVPYPSSSSPDLFERLRALRGNKTMIFSSHRFGSLTRHADLILYAFSFSSLVHPGFLIDRLFFLRYMDNAEIQEAGTHEELLARDGQYARIWRLQAQAFL